MSAASSDPVAPASVLAGTDGGDRIDGTVDDDVLAGLGGTDTLNGGPGADVVDGGDDGDALRGGAGHDTVLGGGGADWLEGDGGDDSLDGGEGDDWLNYYWVNGTGRDTMAGGEGNDRFAINAGADALSLDGGAGDDRFEIIAGASTVIDVATGEGADVIGWMHPYATLTGRVRVIDFQAGVGGDRIDVDAQLAHSASGDNGYTGGNPFDPALGYLQLVQEGADTLLQWDADGAAGLAGTWQTLLTLSAVDAGLVTSANFVGKLVVGTSGADALDGSWTNDTLDGGLGEDTLAGDAGDDTYHVDDSGDVVEERADEGVDQVITSTDHALSGHVENVLVTASAAGGTSVSGNGLDNVLVANDSGNLLSGGAGDDELQGGDGADWLYAGSGDDAVDGGAGDDLIVGGGGRGDDVYIGGAGIDLLRYTSATEGITVNLVSGIATGPNIGRDVLSGIENVRGGRAGDRLTGDAGANLLDGYRGADTLAGGHGNDTYVVNLTTTGTLEDVVIERGGAGNDTLRLAGVSSQADAVALRLGSGLENLDARGTGDSRLNLAGNAADNRLHGNAAANAIAGGGGRDTLFGGDGDDTLSGGLGTDRLVGGDGNDLFVFGKAADTGIGPGTRDVILRFDQGRDRIDLSAIDANTLTRANDAFSSITVGEGFSGSFGTGPGTLYFDLSTMVLYGNTDGDADAEFAIEVGVGAPLTALDIVL